MRRARAYKLLLPQFAYDTGVVGGVLTFDSFKRDFGINASNSSTVSGLSASLLQAGGMRPAAIELLTGLHKILTIVAIR